MTEAMTDKDNKKNVVNLKMLPQEELESEIDFLLAKCQTEVDIKNTAKQGAMFRYGPFQMSISLAVKIKQYQDELLYCRRKPYDILFRVCSDSNWGIPEVRAVDYIPGEGFLFSVIVKNHELESKWRSTRPDLAADLASANFLRYLGLWVNVNNLSLFSDWEQLTDVDSPGQDKDVGNFNRYLDFKDLNVVKTEETSEKQSTSATTVISPRPSIQLQLAKLLYTFLASRGKQICCLADIGIEFLDRIIDDGLEPDARYALYNKQLKSRFICSCKNKPYKLCFCDENFFYLMLLDYYYVHRFDPIMKKISEKMKVPKKEEKALEKDVKDTLFFSNKKGLIKGESSEGSGKSLADISPSQSTLTSTLYKRPRTITTVVSSERKKKKK